MPNGVIGSAGLTMWSCPLSPSLTELSSPRLGRDLSCTASGPDALRGTSLRGVMSLGINAGEPGMLDAGVVGCDISVAASMVSKMEPVCRGELGSDEANDDNVLVDCVDHRF